MNTKIRHPFQVPDDFFENLEKELSVTIDRIAIQKRKKSIALQVIRYAAIVIIAVILGRESVKIYPGDRNSQPGEETISVDLVLSQVPEEDIVDFLADIFSQSKVTE
jgi:hypothetical protein